MNAALRGKPDAGNPHVAPAPGYGGTGRFDEGEVAPPKPRRGSLFYNRRKFIGRAALCAAAGLWIGGAFAAAVNGTAPANLEALRRVAAAERYEITQLKAEPDHVFVAYVLRPTTSSYIRCQLAMPVSAAKWDGRLWGFGNGGPGGWVNVDVGVAKRGSAAVHTDMGTSKGVYGNHEALVDFGWRSTHLMTASAKKFVTAYFGKAPTRCYFRGGSTGGGQGFHEALRFPDDYDGILAYVPANTRLPLHVYFAWNNRLQCDRNGRRVFTDDELATVETAAIDYFADKDEPFARGRFLTDSRYTPEAERGILELAKKKCPSLAEGDKLERLHKMFTGPVLDGKRVHAGIPFSARLKSGAGNQWMLNWYLGPSRAPHTVTDAELAAWLREWSPICDACGEGFAAFAKRGGKMIVVGGLEDSIVPYPSMIDWYERATVELGGRKNLEKACRLYLLPGRAHGRGRGCGDVPDDQRLLVDWVEKGVRPQDVICDLKSGEKLTVPPYPTCFTSPSSPIGVETPKEITVLTWNTEHYGFERKSPHPRTSRPLAIREKIAAMKSMLDEKDRIPLIVGGDFNSMSHLDWTAANGGAEGHCGRVVPWPVSKAMIEAGFTDAYRAVYPDEVKDPGVTHPTVGYYPQRPRPFNRLDCVYSAGSRLKPVAAEVILGDYHKPFEWRGRNSSDGSSDPRRRIPSAVRGSTSSRSHLRSTARPARCCRRSSASAVLPEAAAFGRVPKRRMSR